MAGKPPINAYLSTQVKTASKDQLLLMLFDGAIKFAHRAKTAMAERAFEPASENCMKVQKILTELMGSLDKDMVTPELYRNLMSLYTFCHRKMVAANVDRNQGLVDEAIAILHQLRDVWKQAIEKVLEEFGGKLPSQSELDARGMGAAPQPAAPAQEAEPVSTPAFKPKIQIAGGAGSGPASPAPQAFPLPGKAAPAMAPAAKSPAQKPKLSPKPLPVAKPAPVAKPVPGANPNQPAPSAPASPFFKPKINLK